MIGARVALRALGAGLSIACALFVMGCASDPASVAPGSKPTAGKSILFARSQKSGSTIFASFTLAIENVNRTRRYQIQLQPGGDVTATEVEPDTYQITQFIATNVVGEVIGRSSLKGWPYDVSFTTQPNRAYYLSDFEVSYGTGIALSLPFKAQPNSIYTFKVASSSSTQGVGSVDQGTYNVLTLERTVDRFDATRAALFEKFPNLRDLQVDRAFASEGPRAN